jgi:hypothetical protein
MGKGMGREGWVRVWGVREVRYVRGLRD